MLPRRATLALILAAAGALPALARADTPQTGRLWFYASGNVQLAPSWSFSIIPGLRFEYERTGAASKGHYLDEVFVGPNWSRRFGPLTFKLSGWYYFLGYPRPGSYPISHNLEINPALDLKLGPFTLTYRAIFHNTLYASRDPVALDSLGLELLEKWRKRASFGPIGAKAAWLRGTNAGNSERDMMILSTAR